MKTVQQLVVVSLLLLPFLFLGACQGDNPNNTSPADQQPEVAAKFKDIAELSQKIADDPDNPSLYAARARSFYEHEGYDEAISDLTNALRIDTANVDYLHLLADIYLDYFKSNFAIKTMERAVELYPKRIPSLLKLSEFQLIVKKHSDALKTIERIFKEDPLNAEGFFMTGRVFEDMGEMDKAIRSYEKAVDNDPDLGEVWIKLGRLLAERKDPKAIRYFDNAILVDSLNIIAHFARANYLQNGGQLDKAIAAFRNINRLEPQFADAYYNSGLAYMELDSVDQAIGQFDFAVKMKPTHVMGYFYRGIAWKVKGDLKKAKSDFQQSLNLYPGFERAEDELAKLNEVK